MQDHYVHYGDHFVDKPASCGPAMPAATKSSIPIRAKKCPRASRNYGCAVQVIRGYLIVRSHEGIVDGWLRTGDMARKDEDVPFTLSIASRTWCWGVARTSTAPKWARSSIMTMLPNTVLAYPTTAWARSHRRILKPGASATADTLRAHCATQLSKFKVPRYFWFVEEALPRNASGKFLKRELRESLNVSNAQ